MVFRSSRLLLSVGDLHELTRPPEPLDELVTQLLACGAVLSQMIGGMIEFERSGRSAPDAPPIPEVAHSLIRDVLRDAKLRHSKRDVRVAATIVSEATDAICENIFSVDPELIDQWRSEDSDGPGVG